MFSSRFENRRIRVVDFVHDLVILIVGGGLGVSRGSISPNTVTNFDISPLATARLEQS